MARNPRQLWRSFMGPLRRLWRAAPLLWRARRDPELRMVSRGYIHWLPMSLFSEPLHFARALLGTARRYRVPDQRPYDVYLPHLRAAPFHDHSPHCAMLEHDWQVIRDEYLAVVGDEGPPPNIDHVLAGRWGSFDMVVMGQQRTARASRCPATMATVAALPAADMVTFSSLAPGSKLRPHYGPTNVKLRHQLCLQNAPGARIRVGDEWREWTEGRCNVIDDSFLHEVAHDGTDRRVVMLVDCWHPDLSPRQCDFISALYRAWSD